MALVPWTQKILALVAAGTLVGCPWWGTSASPTPDPGTDAGVTGADAGSPDSGAGIDGGGGDAGIDGGCIAPPASTFSCGGLNNCDSSTSYCVGGAVPSACKPLPVECSTCGTHDCSCLLAHAPSLCNGGTVTCTAYANGELLLFGSNCH